jgi:cell division protein FtsL
VLQIYEHRSSFAALENLKLQKEELSFQSNILIEEVKYFNNHISLRKYASENLGMIMPSNQERVFISVRSAR